MVRNVHSRPCGQEELRGVLGRGRDVLSLLAPSLLATPLLRWTVAVGDQPNVLRDVEAYEAAHGNPFDWNWKEVSEALGPLLHKVCKGSAGVKLKAVLKIDGLQRLDGVGVLVPGHIHGRFHVAADHDGLWTLTWRRT